jgi:hypothetical protein
MVLFGDEHLHPGFCKIAAAHQTANARADDYRVIAICVSF